MTDLKQAASGDLSAAQHLEGAETLMHDLYRTAGTLVSARQLSGNSTAKIGEDEPLLTLANTSLTAKEVLNLALILPLVTQGELPEVHKIMQLSQMINKKTDPGSDLIWISAVNAVFGQEDSQPEVIRALQEIDHHPLDPKRTVAVMNQIAAGSLQLTLTSKPRSGASTTIDLLSEIWPMNPGIFYNTQRDSVQLQQTKQAAEIWKKLIQMMTVQMSVKSGQFEQVLRRVKSDSWISVAIKYVESDEQALALAETGPSNRFTRYWKGQVMNALADEMISKPGLTARAMKGAPRHAIRRLMAQYPEMGRQVLPPRLRAMLDLPVRTLAAETWKANTFYERLAGLTGTELEEAHRAVMQDRRSGNAAEYILSLKPLHSLAQLAEAAAWSRKQSLQDGTNYYQSRQVTTNFTGLSAEDQRKQASAAVGVIDKRLAHLLGELGGQRNPKKAGARLAGTGLELYSGLDGAGRQLAALKRTLKVLDELRNLLIQTGFKGETQSKWEGPARQLLNARQQARSKARQAQRAKDEEAGS